MLVAVGMLVVLVVIVDKSCASNGSSIRRSRSSTPGSMNSLFGDFFRVFWRGILGGVRDYLG